MQMYSHAGAMWNQAQIAAYISSCLLHVSMPKHVIQVKKYRGGHAEDIQERTLWRNIGANTLKKYRGGHAEEI